MDIVESGEASMLTTGAANLAMVQQALWLPQPTSEDKAVLFGYSVGQPSAYVITAYLRAMSRWCRGGLGMHHWLYPHSSLTLIIFYCLVVVWLT